jgi:DNA polymerase alpha-associated DNA helicase A
LPPTILSLKQEERKKERLKKATASKSKKPTSKESSKAGKKMGNLKSGDSPSGEDDDGTSSDTEEEVDNKPEVSSPQSKTNRTVELHPPRTLETTLFDRLEKMYGPSIKRMLQVQYR